MKVAKEKSQRLKETAKRAAYASRRRSEKDRERKNPGLQHPSIFPSVWDEKQFLKKEREAFGLHDITLDVPRGQLCAIAGPVGAGKSSLVQGMIGGETP